MKKFFSKFWRRLKSTHQYSGIKFVGSLPEVPAEVGNDIYIIESFNTAKWVVFNCPCSRGHKLTVNLMKSSYPRWTLRLSGNKVSLSPSVVVTDHPCRSHFWLKSNHVYLAFED
jgi:hypothetical protein